MKDFKRYIQSAASCTANQVYPLSIAEGFQDGDIIADNEKDTHAVLFWHYCGFAYLTGTVTEAFLEKIYKDYFMRETTRRFVLITDDTNVIRFFSGKESILLDQRREYRFDRGQIIPDVNAETDLTIERINASNIRAIKGRIIPAFSWADDASFLTKGFGYVAMDGDQFAAAAFSSAVSSKEVDIGIETNEKYRNRGLAKLLTRRMCQEIMEQGKTPVWAHSISNIGSMRTALSSGFTEKQTNTLIKKV